MFMCDGCIQRLSMFNEWATATLQHMQSPGLTQFFIYITYLFDPVNVSMYVVALLLALWLNKKNKHIEQLIFALGTSAIIVLLFKFGLKIPRPPNPVIEEVGYSFASAHAAVSAVVFLLIAHAYKSHIANKYLRIAFIALCVAIVLLVGISRVYLGVHYATDVLGGYLIAAIIYGISVLIFG